MPHFAVATSQYDELGRLLRRRLWQPLRQMMQIFHVLPLAAAILLFMLLATDGQVRELYISYLEDLNDRWTLVGLIAVLAGFALISAAFYVAHYQLSMMRINVIYSNLSNPETGSMLRGLQRMAAIGIVLVPWLGLLAGLFGAIQYLAGRFAQLQDKIDPERLRKMQHLPEPNTVAIVVSTVLLGLVVAVFLDRYREYRMLRRAVIGAIPFAASALLLLLTEPPFERLKLWTTGVVLAVLFACYYFVYHRLYAMRAGFIYTQPLFRDTGINRRRRRRIALFAWAMVPWLAVAFYFALAPPFAYPDAGRTGMAPSFPCLMGASLPCFASALPVVQRWAVIAVAMTWVAAAGLAVAMLLDSLRENSALQRVIVIAIAVLMLGTLVASQLKPDTIVWMYRGLGPLATMALGVLFLFASFAILAVLSQKSGFPALALVVLAIVINATFPVSTNVIVTVILAVGAVFALMALVARLWAVASVALVLVFAGFLGWKLEGQLITVHSKAASQSAALKRRPDDSADLQKRFDDWLAARHKAATTSGPYPVFIISVEGGGIYAAAAASLFLAKLEDANHGFSQHVFAISGVSGGAIGATVFQALAHSMAGAAGSSGTATRADAVVVPARTSRNERCKQSIKSMYRSTGRHDLTPLVEKIMLNDHFSPVVGSIFPELLGAERGRAEALSESFRRSVLRQDPRAAQELERCFSDHWSEAGQAPALVLNATWAETGLRVAFSPFSLHAQDDFLNSFSDVIPSYDDISLIDAAVVSARFPVILPPYSLNIEERNGGRQRWNFVDGGYADSSGASTALALYRALEDRAREHNAKITIILLTSATAQINVGSNETSISGTPFRDTIAPIAAVMNVRERLGSLAVARVCDHFQFHLHCKAKAKAADAGLKIVEIEDQAYRLPLGWKLSHTTFEVVEWMLGDPARCHDRNASSAVKLDMATTRLGGAQPNEQSFESNGCVLKFVSDVLKSQRRTGQ
jgi:hypothetical protein